MAILKDPESIDSRFTETIDNITKNYVRLSEMSRKLIAVGDSPTKLEIIDGAHRITAIFYRKLKEQDFTVEPMQVYQGINKATSR
jgi:hypothetical protein